VTQYLVRLAIYEDRLNAALYVNPRALDEADALDRERAQGRIRGPLHGIPVALKDNILTPTRCRPAAACSRSAATSAPYEATLATNLKRGGRHHHRQVGDERAGGWFAMARDRGLGYNAVGRATTPTTRARPARHGRTPVLETSGSSSGIGVAANLWAGKRRHQHGRVDHEGPSNATMLVGIRPPGRISRYGIIPITLDHDTAGPMTRTVTDAAIMLGALEGASPTPTTPRTRRARRRRIGTTRRFCRPTR
jgi:amidase